MKKVLPVFLLTLACSVPAFAHMNGMERGHWEGEHYGHRMDMPMMGHMMEACLEEADNLGLSDQQIAKIKAVHRNMERTYVRLSADKEIAEMDLKDTMEVKDFDYDKAAEQVQKISKIKADMHMEMLKSMKQIRSILTEEQFKKMTKLHRHMMGKPHHEGMEEEETEDSNNSE